MKLNDYFDKIYLLNLFKREERRKGSESRLKSNSIDYNVFNGVDGSVMKFLWKKLDNSNFSNENYIGCFISHLSIYKDAIERGYNRILILEDDILVHRYINEIFDAIKVPDWSDLFYLGYIPLNDDCSMWDYKYGINNSNIIVNNVFSPTNLWGLFAYGISRSLMVEMVDLYNNEFPMEIDRYYVNVIQKRGNSISLSPQLFCCSDEAKSDNLGYTPPDMKLRSVDTRFSKLEDYI